MSHLNSFALWEFAKSRQEELLKEAEEARLVRLSRKSRIRRPRLRHRLARSIGNSMIGFGQWLKARQKPIL